MYIATLCQHIPLFFFHALGLWTTLPVETAAQAAAGKEFTAALSFHRIDGGERSLRQTIRTILIAG